MIPIEFISGFWITTPEGLRGKGSGFIMAENIKNIISINTSIKESSQWTLLELSERELNDPVRAEAICQIIYETWIDTHSLIIVGSYYILQKILILFLEKYCKVNHEQSMKIIMSKIQM